MIDKLPLHFSFTTPASVHDEEALTALELAGRQGAKINEVIEDQNKLRSDVPDLIEKSVREHIEMGEFDEAISDYAGELDARLDNLLGSVEEGSTTMDAEIIDARVGADYEDYDTLGQANREQFKKRLRVENHFEQVYIADRGELLSVEQDDGLLIRPTGSLTFRGLFGKTFTPNTLMSMLGSDNVVTIDDEQYVNVKSSHCFVYDMNGLFSVVPRENVDVTRHLLLLSVVQGLSVGGALERYLTSNRIADSEKRLAILNKFAGTQVYPSDTYQFSKVEVVDNAIHLSWSSALSVRGALNAGWTVSTAQTSVGSEFSGDNCIIIPHTYCLVLNLKESGACSLLVVKRDEVDENQLVLLANVGGHAVSGELLPFINQGGTSGESTGVTSIPDEVKRFNAIVGQASSTAIKFLLFTDPHIVTSAGWEKKGFANLDVVKRYAELASIDFTVCLGDWLNNPASKEEACANLGAVTRYMSTNVPKFINILGNHDNNLYGTGGILSLENLNNLAPVLSNMTWESKAGFDPAYRCGCVLCENANGHSYKIFIFDTWECNYNNLTTYDEEQIRWFLDEITNLSVDDHIIIFAHGADAGAASSPLMGEVRSVLDYVGSGVYQAPWGEEIDLGSCTSPLNRPFMFCGHTHEDADDTTFGLCTTTPFTNYGEGEPTFDLVCVDYDRSVINMIRVGEGEDRTLNI